MDICGQLLPQKQEFSHQRAAKGCNIQINLPTVIREHAKLKVQVTDGVVNITALSKSNNTKLNGAAIPNDTPVLLYQSDVVTIGDRHFRWYYPNRSRLSQAKRHKAGLITTSSLVKKVSVESEDSSIAAIKKRIMESKCRGLPAIKIGHKLITQHIPAVSISKLH